MSLTAILIVIALPLLVMGAAIVASSEAAIFSLNYGDRLRLSRQHPRAARAIAELLARPSDLLVTLLFSNMMLITMFFVLTSLLITEIGKPWLGIIISIIDLLVVMVVAEIASKMLAVRRRVELVRFNALPVLALVRLMAPMRRVAMPLIIQPLTRLFLPPGRAPTPSLTTEELAALLHVGTEEGAINDEEQRVLRQVIHLGDTRIKDVMTPRTDMVMLDESDGAESVAAVARERRLTRVPVCRGGRGNGPSESEILGILDVKRYLAAAARTSSTPPLRPYLDEARYVPERATLDQLLEQLRVWGAKLAMCVDEHGSITGVVSARDAARQIATEFAGGEADAPGSLNARFDAEGRWIVNGRFPARSFTEMFELSGSGWRQTTTVAGLVISLLGRQPRVGDRVDLGNVRLTVRALRGRVADEVAVEVMERGSAPGDAGARDAAGAGATSGAKPGRST